MSISMDCPGCGRTLRIPESKRGTIRPCPACGALITIPAEGELAGPGGAPSRTGGPGATRQRLDTARLAKFGDPQSVSLPEGVKRGRLPSTARVPGRRLSADGGARTETGTRKKPDTSRRTKTTREKATQRRQREAGLEGESQEEGQPRPFDPQDWGWTARGLGILGVSELIALTCMLLQLPALSSAMRSMITGETAALAEALTSDMMVTLLVAVRIVGGLGVLGATSGIALCILARSEPLSRTLAILALLLRAAALLMAYDAVISGDPGGLLPALACYLLSVLAVSAMLWRGGNLLGDPALGKGSRIHVVSIVALIAVVGGIARRVRAFITEESDPIFSSVLVLVVAFLLLAWLFAYAYLAGQGMRSIQRAGSIARARLAHAGVVV